MKSVDPGILPQSYCSTFQPSELAKQSLIYMTWCGHYFCTKNYFMERDTYPENLLIFVRNGKMDFRYQGEEFTANKGDIVLMDCVHPHYYRAHDGLEFIYIHFDGLNSHELVNSITALNRSSVFHQDTNVEIGKELYDTALRYERGTVINALHVHFWINQLLYKMSLVALPPIQDGSPVDQAIHHILNHIGEPITLEDLSSLTNFSTCYLSHAFKKQTGYSPSEYIINTRLEKAQRLLTHSHMTVSDIAYEVGYGSPSSFINVFTRKVGITPKAYRNMQKSKSGNVYGITEKF